MNRSGTVNCQYLDISTFLDPTLSSFVLVHCGVCKSTFSFLFIFSCQVCGERDRRYCCPRCGKLTCSLPCCLQHKKVVRTHSKKILVVHAGSFSRATRTPVHLVLVLDLRTLLRWREDSFLMSYLSANMKNIPNLRRPPPTPLQYRFKYQGVIIDTWHRKHVRYVQFPKFSKLDCHYHLTISPIIATSFFIFNCAQEERKIVCCVRKKS